MRVAYNVEMRMSVTRDQAEWLERRSRSKYVSRAQILRELITKAMEDDKSGDADQVKLDGFFSERKDA